MSDPRRKKPSRTGSQQTNRYFHILVSPLRLVANHRDPAAQENLSKNTPDALGRRSSDRDHIDLYDHWLSLSEREQDVTHLTCQGHTNRQIAFKMGVSERTVKSYLEHVFYKVNVSNKIVRVRRT